MSRLMLKTLAMNKYARLLPRIFPACDALEVHDIDGALVWHWQRGNAEPDAALDTDDDVGWNDFGNGIERRTMPDGRMQFRGPLAARGKGTIGWFVVGYDTTASVPMDTALEPLRRAFADAASFMQEEMDLQLECDQLATELTERYEELNLVYTTDDRVEHVEEGQQALVQLVRNCADYLDVGLAALICKERNLELHDINRK